MIKAPMPPQRIATASANTESYGGADSTPPPCSFLHRILSATDGVLNLPRSTIHLTFGLHLGIAGHLPSRFLHLAGRILGRTLHAILVHVDLLVSSHRLAIEPLWGHAVPVKQTLAALGDFFSEERCERRQWLRINALRGNPVRF